MKVSLWLNNKEFRLNLQEKGERDLEVSFSRKTYHVSAEFLSTDEILLTIDGKIHNVFIESNANSHSVFVNGKSYIVEKKSASQILGIKSRKQEKRNIETSMPGRIVRVLLKEGEEVGEGEAVLILEAMKMQNEIKSPVAGRITRIIPREGESVEAGSLLFSVE
jgi:biotin carboxyl carrier protein